MDARLSSTPVKRKRPFLAALVMLLTCAVGAQAAVDIILPWHPAATFGFSAAIDGRIMTVLPDSSAAAAGLHVGDRIDVAALEAAARRRVSYLSLAPTGEHLTFPIVRNGVRREVDLVAAPLTRTVADNITDVIEVLERLASLAIAATLLLVRPSLLTWSFFFITSGAEGGGGAMAWTSDHSIGLLVAGLDAITIAGTVFGIVFAMLFPRSTLSRTERGIVGALVALGVAWFVFDVSAGYSIWFSWITHGSASFARLVDAVNIRLTVALYVAAVVAFYLNYTHSAPSERVRMRWVALGFAVGAIGQFGPAFSRDLLNISPPLAVTNLLLSLSIFIPLTVAYAVLRHRVIDVRFAASRALVYGALMTIAVVLLTVLDFAVARRIEAAGVGLIVEIAGAVAIGLSIHRLHGWVEGAIDRYVFRAVHAAERRLEVVGKSFMFAPSQAAIDGMLCSEAAAALRLTHVRVVRELDSNDPLVLELRAERASLAHGEDLIIPLVVRHDVLGYAAYGPHDIGSAIDPTERAILERLTHAASVATDHVGAEARLVENSRLQIENALLRSMLNPNASRDTVDLH